MASRTRHDYTEISAQQRMCTECQKHMHPCTASFAATEQHQVSVIVMLLLCTFILAFDAAQREILWALKCSCNDTATDANNQTLIRLCALPAVQTQLFWPFAEEPGEYTAHSTAACAPNCIQKGGSLCVTADCICHKFTGSHTHGNS